MSFILLGILNSQVEAAGGGSFELIQSTILTGTQSSVTFTNLDTYASTYKHLQLRMTVRKGGTFTASNMDIRLNSDTNTNYNSHVLRGNTTDVVSVYTSGAFAQLENVIADGGAGANIFSSIILDILDFSNTSKNTTIRSMSGVVFGSSLSRIALTSNLWRNTAAVTSLELSATDMVAGSRFSLYGIRG